MVAGVTETSAKFRLYRFHWLHNRLLKFEVRLHEIGLTGYQSGCESLSWHFVMARRNVDGKQTLQRKSIITVIL